MFLKSSSPKLSQSQIKFKFKQIRAYSELLISYRSYAELYNQVLNEIEPIADDLIRYAPDIKGSIQLEMIFRQKDRLLDTIEHRTTLWHLISQAAFNGLLELL